MTKAEAIEAFQFARRQSPTVIYYPCGDEVTEVFIACLLDADGFWFAYSGDPNLSVYGAKDDDDLRAAVACISDAPEGLVALLVDLRDHLTLSS